MTDGVTEANDRTGGRKSTGVRGEEAAALYLRRKGCTILARNWRAKPGEVDIIATCPVRAPAGLEDVSAPATVLAFVEVRTRHGRQGLAEESISERKANSMITAAYAYMSLQGLDPETTPWRIDLLAIAVWGGTMAAINWVQGALEA